MSDYTAMHGDDASMVVDRLVLKGKDILELCMERGNNLSMKGFIDSQIEKGEAYLPVVEQTMSYVDHRIDAIGDRRQKELLRDLHNYIGQQLQLLETVAHSTSGPG